MTVIGSWELPLPPEDAQHSFELLSPESGRGTVDEAGETVETTDTNEAEDVGNGEKENK